MSSQLNIVNVEEYLVEIVRELNPDMDLREGTAVRDLLIKALRVVMEPLVEELVRIGNAQSLLNSSIISDNDMDELVANVFVTRRGGEKSTGIARIFLLSSDSAVEIPLGTIFQTITGLRFLATQRTFISKQSLALNLDGSFFYVDVPVEAEKVGAQYNVDAGTINSMLTSPVNFVRVSNLSPTQDGVNLEDNITLGDRAQVAITVRDLVTEPGIITQLLETYQSMEEIQPIGFGDIEMIRDIVTTDGTYLKIGNIDYPPASGTSIGGMVDIYVKPVARTTEEIVVASMTDEVALREQEIDDPAPTGTLQYLSNFKRPAVDILEIEELDAITLLPNGTFLAQATHWNVVVENPTITFSTREKKKLVLTPAGIIAAVGRPFVIRYLHSTDITTAQTYVETDVNRTVSASLLAKHAVPVFVDMDLTVTQPVTFTQTAQDYIDAVTAFINARELGETLEASDIVDALYDVADSSSKIKVDLPIDMEVEEHAVDGTITISTQQDEYVVDRTKMWLPRIITVTVGN